ncbi:hypothetical protein OTU49_003654 [Cherax quadricarinatus]|uniref:NACHT domain-containing protein n=1 Tax=Cherax quadricarinatus TaxID=27406 RepID=A0AAW0VPE0_CHEQU
MKASIVASITQIPGNYTSHDLCFGKYFKAVNKIGKMVLISIFTMIYQTLDTNCGTLPLKEYCTKKLKWSHSDINKHFTASERDILSKAPFDSEFICDVTLIFKIITRILGNLAEPIKKELRDLKNLRNTVCHEDLEMNEAELRQRMDDLECVCRAIIEGTAALIGKDLKDLITEVKQGLQDLVNAKLEINDIQSYLQDLEFFRQEKHSKMITEGRKELMATYSKVKILNPCSWLSENNFADFTVDNVFTALRIVDNGINVQVSDILNVTQMKTRYIPRVVIIKGVMGAGKTSLYRYLLNEWCKRSSAVTGLIAIDIVIGIEMRTVSCGSLVQFLREQLLKNTSRLFSESDIIPVLQEMNVLFVIDGMDEASNQGKAIVREIVSKFTDSHIIITTRPEFTLELMQMAEDHIVLQVEGFDDDSQNEFVKKVFAVKYVDIKRRENEIRDFFVYKASACESLSNHLTLPLTLTLLLVLWCDDSLKVTTVSTTTRLYQNIYDMSQKKLTTRLESLGEGHSVSLSRKVRRWLLELGHIAWCMLKEEVLHLSQDHANFLMDICEKEGINPIQTMSTFLKCDLKETLTGTSYYFSFHHSSGQEFLAALYISEEASKSWSLFPLFEDIKCSRLQELIMYVTGLLKINGKMTSSLASEIKCSLISCMGALACDPVIWWRLLEEAEKDPAVCQIVGSFINQVKLWVINSWDAREMIEAKLKLLQETGAAPSEVVIHIQYTTSFIQCSELQNIIMLIGEIGKSKVRLYLDSQFHTAGNQEDIDTHVVPLLKLNRLLEFKGYASELFTSELVKATRVQSLFIRITSLKALFNLHTSIRKHRRWKVKIMPSRKWTLKYLELFLDISTTTKTLEIPQLHFNHHLVVKLAGITDSSAVWAGEVLKRLHKQYNSVILQASDVTLTGMKHLLNTANGVSIKTLRVMSNCVATQEEVNILASKSGVKIGWGCA